MGIIINKPLIWLNARNGMLSYRISGDEAERTATGFAGVIDGVRTREKLYEGTPRTMIEVRMRDDADGMTFPCVISGTMIDSSGTVTVFGKMLLARLAHPSCLQRKGQPIVLNVWGAKDNDRITCCTLRDANTNEPLGAYDTREIAESDLPAVVQQWVARAIECFGTFGHDDGSPQSSSPELEPTPPFEENDLPF